MDWDAKRGIHMSGKRTGPIEPFRLWNNVCFVGSQAVSVHLIDTGDGLLLIDTGYPFMRDEIVRNIRSLGFDPADVRGILHSHGHYDHYGNTLYLKALSGAETWISRIDNEIINGRRDLSWAVELGYERLEPFDCDHLLEDGDVVALGDVRIRCRLAPGYTEGTLAFFFESGGMRLAMHGGVGLNSMAASFLAARDLPRDLPERFRESLHALKAEPVDIVLGNHPEQSDTEAKAERLRAGDLRAFVDPGEWPRFLDACEARLDEMLARERAERS